MIRVKIKWYLRDGVEGRISGEDLIVFDETELESYPHLTKDGRKRMFQRLMDETVDQQKPILPKFFNVHSLSSVPMNWKVTSFKEIPYSKYEILVREVNIVLDQYKERMTLRQIYYRLVAKLIIPNNLNEYKGLSRHLVKARELGAVDYRRIEDRTRSSIGGDSGSESAMDYFKYRVKSLTDSHKYFNLSMWGNQETFVEVWIEKDALSRITSNVANAYAVRTCPSRGYPSFSYVKDAANRLRDVKHEKIVIIYLGDFDPSGLDIPRDLHSRLVRYGVPSDKLTVDRVALTIDQIEEYNLPPAPAKRSDARYQGFVDKTGADDVVELDALEPPVLQQIVREAIGKYIESELWHTRIEEGNEERDKLEEMLNNLMLTYYDPESGEYVEYDFDEEDEE